MPALGLILVGAGSSRRMGGVQKIWAPIGEKSLVCYSLERLAPAAAFAVLVVRADDVRHASDHTAGIPNLLVVTGGQERQESVEKGIAALPEDVDVIAVHDVARPFAARELISRGIKELHGAHGAIPAIEPVDTLKVTNVDGYVQGTIDRSSVRAVQTPQLFRASALREAHARTRDTRATDDASLLEGLGYKVKVFAGSPMNFKVTTEHDLTLARLLVSSGLVE